MLVNMVRFNAIKNDQNFNKIVYFQEFFKDLVKHAGERLHIYKNLYAISEIQKNQLEMVFANKEFQKVMAEEQFDMVIFEANFGDAFIGFGAHFKCPTVVFGCTRSNSNINDYIGNLDHLSFVRHPVIFHSDGKMTFFQRVINFSFSVVIQFFWDNFIDQSMYIYE